MDKPKSDKGYQILDGDAVGGPRPRAGAHGVPIHERLPILLTIKDADLCSLRSGEPTATASAVLLRVRFVRARNGNEAEI